MEKKELDLEKLYNGDYNYIPPQIEAMIPDYKRWVPEGQIVGEIAIRKSFYVQPQYKILVGKIEELGKRLGKKFSVVVMDALIEWYKNNSGIRAREKKLYGLREQINYYSYLIGIKKEYLLKIDNPLTKQEIEHEVKEYEKQIQFRIARMKEIVK